MWETESFSETLHRGSRRKRERERERVPHYTHYTDNSWYPMISRPIERNSVGTREAPQGLMTDCTTPLLDVYVGSILLSSNLLDIHTKDRFGADTSILSRECIVSV